MLPPEIQRVSQRRQCPSTRLRGVTARKTVILMFIVVGKSKQIQIVLIMPAERCDINIETNRE
jgi:3-polyprenyl-4-hydroxybenzoate decarboxylase